MRSVPMYIPRSSLTCAHCACPRLLAMAWETPQCYGGILPFLLVAAPASDEATHTIERIVAELKLRPNLTTQPPGAKVLLESDGWARNLVTLVLGSEEIKRIPVTTGWKELARQRSHLHIVLGLPTQPASADADSATDEDGRRSAILFMAQVHGARRNGQAGGSR